MEMDGKARDAPVASGVPSGLARDRAGIERRIHGATLCDLLARNAARHGRRAALAHRTRSGWRHMSWQRYATAVAEAALGLELLGVGRGDALLVLSPPRPEALIADLAALHLGAIPVFPDAGSSPEQLAWIVEHTGARVLAVAGVGSVRRARAAGADQVVALDDVEGDGTGEVVPFALLLERGRARLARDPDRLRQQAAPVRPDDVATLCYGPAADGSRRAVVVTHRAALWAAAAIERWAAGTGAVAGGRTVSYLPLSHSGGRLFGHYLPLWAGMSTACAAGTDLVFEAVVHSRPSLFVGVPLVWERVVALRRDEPARAALTACRLPVSIGATLPSDLSGRLRSEQVDLLDMYGMTETFGPIAAHRPGRPRAGTVGPPFPGLHVYLGKDGEVLVQSPNGIPGYFRDPEASAETYAADGVVRTGDLGRFDGDGHLVLVGRKRGLIVTAGGRNVAPAPLERGLEEHPLIRRACVVGEGRAHLVALVALAPSHLGSGDQDGGDADEPTVLAQVGAAVERVNAGVARGERIRDFALVTDDWSTAGGELGSDGAVDRSAVERRHRALVEAMYERSRRLHARAG